MKITIFSECPDPNYYQSLYYLKELGKVIISVYDSRFLYLLVKFFGFGKISKKVMLQDLLRSFFAPFILLFKRDIIVGFAPYSIWVYYLLLLKLLNKNMIYVTSWPYWDNKGKYIHSSFFTRWFWLLFLKDIKVITPTVTVAHVIKKYRGNVKVIPHGINLNLFFPKRIKHRGMRILYVGRLVEEKGIYDLITIAKKFENNHSVEFWVVGGGRLENLKEKKIPNLKFFGEIKDKEKLAEIYNSCDILILLSKKIKKWEEFFGIVLIEAMATGTPVIAFDNVGPREILSGGLGGFLIQKEDKEEVYNKIKLIMNNPSKRKELSLSAIKVASRFDMSKLSAQWLEILSENN